MSETDTGRGGRYYLDATGAASREPPTDPTTLPPADDPVAPDATATTEADDVGGAKTATNRRRPANRNADQEI